jgi:amino acid transporter
VATVKRFLSRHAMKLCYMSILAIVIYVITFYYKPIGRTPDVLKDLSSFQIRSINVLVEMNTLGTTLAMLLAGGIGGFMVTRESQLKKLGYVFKACLVLSLLVAVVSIYFGYVSHSHLVSMLTRQQCDVYNPLIESPRRLQFYALILAAGLFGLSVVSLLDKRKR